MIKTLRPYQKQCLTTLRQRLKQVTHPLLVNASVGSGKSLILSELLLDMERSVYRALCLTMNSTLIQQNAETYRLQGGNPGIYCAGLGYKDTTQCVIFASPHSIVKQLPDIPFNLIIIDECHNINYHDSDTMLMRILNHYGQQAQFQNRKFRIVGLTGTPYRGKGESIVGPNQFFKEQVCSISTSWLIENKYLTKPYFGTTHVDAIDFSDCHVENTGKFRHKDLEKSIHKDIRLTGKIMKEVQTVVESKHNGAFIFAATKQHCIECANSLPTHQTAIITGDTPHDERRSILDRAKTGEIKYLVNVNVLCTGVDVPNFDVVAWLRPTESLVLYTQGVGRGLRLHPGKSSCTVLDYAGNLDRHGDIDDPIINEAIRPNPDNEAEYVIPCYTCSTNNKVTSRRCCGIWNGSRCTHFFLWKDCSMCGVKNDTTSRYCRGCTVELVDPNAKLKLATETKELCVDNAKYYITTTPTGHAIINVTYICGEKKVFEHHFTNSEKSKNIFYAKFVRHHVDKPSEYYMCLSNPEKMKEMIQSDRLKTPTKIVCKNNNYNRWELIKKIF